MYQGSIVALITPMHVDGSIDKKAFHELIEWHVHEKTDGIVIAGTTGESPTLEAQEHFDLIQYAVKTVAGRLPVIAGSGTNSTKGTLKLSESAKKAGADALLVVAPYYNKPTQAGLYQHFKYIVEKSQMPTILYNVPGRTACDILPETVEKLAQLPGIIGIKEATGDINRTKEIIKRCGTDFLILSGEDKVTLALMEAGAKGVISVTANIAPRQMHELCQAANAENFALAHEINQTLEALHHDLFLESNPIPTKWALSHLGKIEPGIRMPLLTLDSQYHHQVKKAMQHAGVI